jgi:hypothetical protein
MPDKWKSDNSGVRRANALGLHSSAKKSQLQIRLILASEVI